MVDVWLAPMVVDAEGYGDGGGGWGSWTWWGDGGGGGDVSRGNGGRVVYFGTGND